MTYINRIVTDLLLFPKKDISYLKILKELSDDKNIEIIDIFSLNHDLLLESYFDKNNIIFCDGFSEPTGKSTLKHIDLKLFNGNNKINLLKLHGSSNWFRYKEFIAKSISSHIDHKKDENGNHIIPVSSKAEILIGTFNKLIDYNYGIFSELFCLFINRLNQINILIISGYSFGDEGINAKIIEWYYKDSRNKIVLIDPNFDNQKKESPINYKLNDRLCENRLFPIKKHFQDATYEEVSFFLKLRRK
ncbi:MAG: SIR2 family protein [FCB group bacterium]|nr:SIR2 family protein [FCB group bacterium]